MSNNGVVMVMDDNVDDENVRVVVDVVDGSVHVSPMRTVRPIDTYWLTRSTIDRCACGVEWDRHTERRTKPEWLDDVARH